MNDLFRLGDGNEGNFPRFTLTTDHPFEALEALVLDDFCPSHLEWAQESLDVDGEPEYGVYATIYEGPDGEQAFGAAWLTAELQPMTETDMEHSRRPHYDDLRDIVSEETYARYLSSISKEQP